MYSNLIKCDCGAPVDLDQTDWCDACDKSIFAEPENKAMTPKEKAEELFVLYEGCYPENYDKNGKNFFTDNIKKSALIAVDEILKVAAPYIDKHESYYQELDDNQTQVYWQEVKLEIDKL